MAPLSIKAMLVRIELVATLRATILYELNDNAHNYYATDNDQNSHF
jgi:hypothetical protein